MIQIETILDIIFKGFIIGVVASAPMGPVGVLCIQRTLNKGRWFGFVTGIGAALSDIIYALLTGYGMSFVLDYINKNVFYPAAARQRDAARFRILYVSQQSCGAMRPVKQGKAKGTYLHNFITAFVVCFSNPLIIFLFIGLFARFAFVQHGVVLFEAVTSYVAIFTGALCWWLCITFFVNKLRKHFNLRGIWIINRVFGAVVMIASLAGLIFTLLGESLY
jgi:threonine/homoserine/homoserine lactone efflux protein